MMNRLASPLTFLLRRSTLLSTPSPTSFSTSTSSSSPSILSHDDLAHINSLIHRLCDSNHHQEAIRLLSASLLASPPLSSLPIPFLADRLSSLPDMSSSMSLLTTLRHHNPPPTPIIPLCSNLLISSYIQKRRLKEAAKVFSWLCREDTPCRPDAETYRILVGGLYSRNGRAMDVVKVAREMVRDGIEVGEEIRGLVWRSMLREARVDEGKELDDALAGGSRDGAGELIDRMIRDWEE